MITVKVGDVFHVYCDWATGGYMEAIIQVTERPHGSFKYVVLKEIENFKGGREYSNALYTFFGGAAWTSTRITKRELKNRPELFL